MERLPTNRDHEIVETIDGIHIISMTEEALAEIVARALVEEAMENDNREATSDRGDEALPRR